MESNQRFEENQVFDAILEYNDVLRNSPQITRQLSWYILGQHRASSNHFMYLDTLRCLGCVCAILNKHTQGFQDKQFICCVNSFKYISDCCWTDVMKMIVKKLAVHPSKLLRNVEN